MTCLECTCLAGFGTTGEVRYDTGKGDEDCVRALTCCGLVNLSNTILFPARKAQRAAFRKEKKNAINIVGNYFPVVLHQ